MLKFGSTGTGNGQFNYARALGFYSGNIYVGETTLSRRIQKFNTSGTYQATLVPNTNGDVYDIATDSSANIWDLINATYPIRKYNSEGVYQGEYSHIGSNPGWLNTPKGIDFSSDGKFYVADYGNDRVQRFTAAGAYDNKFWATTDPGGLAIDSVNNIYVTDQTNNLVKKYTSEGVYVTQWGGFDGTPPLDDGKFYHPGAIAIDNYDNIYVCDEYNSRVQKFNSNGAFLDKWGSNGSGNMQFFTPLAVEANGEGIIYVVDYPNNRVIKFGDSAVRPANTTPNDPSSLGPSNVVSGGWINSTQPSFSYTLTDPNSEDTVKYQVQIDDSADFGSRIVDYTSEVDPSSSASFAVGQAAGEGTYTTGSSGQTLGSSSYYWRVKAIDYVGAGSSYTTANSGAIAFRIDVTAPTNDAGTDKIRNAQFSQDATVTDNVGGSGIATYSWSKVSGPGNVNFGTPNAEDTTVSCDQDGAYVIRLTTADNATNSTTDDINLTWDTTAPATDAGSSQVKNALFNQDATVNDPTSGVATYAWSKVSGPGSVTFGTPNAEDTTISCNQDGTYLLRLSTTDNATNSTFDEMIFTWDTVAPDTNAGSDQVKKAQFTQNATVSDLTSGIDTCSWSKVSGPGTVTFGSENAEDTTISCDQDGDYVIRLTTTDNATNSSTDDMALTWDATAPSIPGTATTSSPTNDKTPTWTWTASNDGTGVGLHATPYTVEWSQDNTFVSGVSTSTSTTNSFTHSLDLADGTWYFRVKAKDILDNSSTYSGNGSVFIQSNPPVTTPTIPPSNGNNNWHKTVPTITLSTDIASTTYYKWDSASSWTTYTSPFSARRGSHTLYYYSTNGIDETVKHRHFYIDDYKPKIRTKRIGTLTKEKTYKIRYKVSDPYSSIARVTVKVKKGNRTYYRKDLGWVKTGSFKYFRYKASLGSDKYYLKIYAKDRAGNWQYRVSSTKFEIKRIYPTLKYGSIGSDVILLQERLNAHRVSVWVDGVFWDNTLEAVRLFKNHYGLPNSDIVDQATWNYLMKAPGR